MSKFEQKPGSGVLFQKKNKSENGPSYTGFYVLPDGRVIGLALWAKKTSGGTLLSLSQDDREGEYQAKKNGLPQMTIKDTAQPNAAGSAKAASKRDREEERGRFSDDLDDEIPF